MQTLRKRILPVLLALVLALLPAAALAEAPEDLPSDLGGEVMVGSTDHTNEEDEHTEFPEGAPSGADGRAIGTIPPDQPEVPPEGAGDRLDMGPSGVDGINGVMPAASIASLNIFDVTDGDIVIEEGTSGSGFLKVSYDGASVKDDIAVSDDIIIIGSTMDHTVTVDGVAANLTLNGASIDVSATDNATAFRLQSGAEVTLTLVGDNTLKSGAYRAGIRTTGSELTIGGDGSLKTYGGNLGAGIGGGQSAAGGVLYIVGGDVYAESANGGAGIGGGWYGAGGTIAISGGTVEAVGGYQGAGIGGGYYSSSGSIEISGSAEVTATGGGNAAGIGGGYYNGGDSIVILGGWVKAQGGIAGAGIGGGDFGTSGVIHISGGIVEAIAGDSSPSNVSGAGIGGGRAGNGDRITIDGDAQVTASGGPYGAGIGGGGATNAFPAGDGGVIAIGGSADVTATAGDHAAGIGGGAAYHTGHIGEGGTVTIGGGTVRAEGKDDAPDIGSGEGGAEGGSLEVTGGAEVYLQGNGTNADPLDLRDCTIGGGGAARQGINGDYDALGARTNRTIDIADPDPTDAGGGTGWTYANNLVTIVADGSYLIYGATDANTIAVGSGVEASITLRDVTIFSFAPSIDVAGSKLVLTLEGKNVLTSNTGAGIHVPEGSELTLTARDKNQSLMVAGGGNCAGIGGSDLEHGGTVIIGGGTIDALGGRGAAAIGGGRAGDGGHITVAGDATLLVEGGRNGAGIGGGGGQEDPLQPDRYIGGNGGTITIEGGKIEAKGLGGGAGIGGGNYGSGGIIMIKAGFIDAESSTDGAGIGGGYQGGGGKIFISGGTIDARGGQGAAGIGGGYEGEGGDITVTGDAFVTATGNQYGAGIGGGYFGAGGVIAIGGNVEVTAKGARGGAGIGGGSFGAGGSITISGGTIEAIGGDGEIGDPASAGGAGIGGGHAEANETVLISGGEIEATGGPGAAGIGGGNGRSGGVISIEGDAMVRANATTGAAIGGGRGAYAHGSAGAIVIVGGEVAAHSTDGIGLGGSAGTLVIRGANTRVTAQGNSADIALGALWVGEGANLLLLNKGADVARDGSGLQIGACTIADADGGAYGDLTGIYSWLRLIGGTADISALPAYWMEDSSAGQIVRGDEVLQLTADAPAERMVFSRWSAADGGDYFVDAAAAVTAFTMPHRDMAVVATYVEEGGGSATTYSITIENGTAAVGAGVVNKAQEGVTVTLTADAAPSGQVFDRWVVNSGNPIGLDVTANPATFTMPGEAVWITAAYKGDSIGTATRDRRPPTADSSASTVVTFAGVPTGSIKVGERFTVIPANDTRTGSAGWEYDSSFFSATFNSPATFTALRAGSSTITYTAADGSSASFTVTVTAADETAAPDPVPGGSAGSTDVVKPMPNTGARAYKTGVRSAKYTA